MGDDRNQKQPDYFNPDNFFADDSFGTSLGDDYASFFSDDDVTPGGEQGSSPGTPDQNLSDWMADTEQKQGQMPNEGAASDFWDWGDVAGQSGQNAGPQPGTGSSQYGGQQPGTGSSPYGGQQPNVPNDGPVILGGIDGGSKKPKKGLPVPAIAAIAVAVALAVGVPYFLHSRQDPEPVAPVDDPDDPYDDDDDTYVSYSSGYVDYGKDYNDFYTNKYAMAMANYGYAADEICVIDNTDYIGSAEAPRQPETYYSLFIHDNKVTLLAPLQSSYMDCGYTICFAGEDTNYDMAPGIIVPPETVDRDRYFEMVKEGFNNLEDYEKDDYIGIEFGDISTVSMNGNTISYMEVRYSDTANNAILDTFSFEERPSGNAFLTEYRCRQNEAADGAEALGILYGKLTFYTEGFDSIDASKHVFTTGRIYDKGSRHWAEFVAPEFDHYEMAGSSIEGPDQMYFGYSNRNSSYKSIWIEYESYSSVNSHDSFEEHVEQKLEYEESSEYISDVTLTDQKEFTFSGYDAYFYSYDKTEHYGNSPTDVRVYEYRIHTSADEEIYVWINNENPVEEDAFDPEAFLRDYLTLN